MKAMTWKTFARKLRDGELEVLAWSTGDLYVDVILIDSKGRRRHEWLELTGKKVEL